MTEERGPGPHHRDPREPSPSISTDEQQSPATRRRFRKRLLSFGLLAVVLTAAFIVVDINASMRALGEWIDSLGWWAPPLFIAVHALAVVVLIPGAVFPLMAGFLFGPAFGAIYSALGKTLGAFFAFSIARHLIRGHRRSVWLRELRKRFEKLALLEDSAVRGGWKSLALIRLIPAVPFKLSSYLFGWTKFKSGDFILGTFVGTIPFSITNAYLGSLVSHVGRLDETPLPTTQTGTLFYGAAAAIALSAALIAGVKAKAVLRDAEALKHKQGGQ